MRRSLSPRCAAPPLSADDLFNVTLPTQYPYRSERSDDASEIGPRAARPPELTLLCSALCACRPPRVDIDRFQVSKIPNLQGTMRTRAAMGGCSAVRCVSVRR